MLQARITRTVSRNWIALALITFTATSFAGNSWWEKNKGAEAEEFPEEPVVAEEAPKAAPAPVPIAAEEAKPQPAQTEVVPSLDVNSKPKKRAKSKKKKSRQIASVSSVEMESGYRREADFTLTVGVVGGVNATVTTTNNTSGNVGTLTQAGIVADLSYNYVGLEIDSIYTFGGSDSNSMSMFNGLANLKAQLPLHLGRVLVKPKAGIGFGMLSMSQSAGTTTSTSVASGSMSGLYVTGGIDIVPFRWLMITADYTQSISTSSSFATTLTPTGGSATTSDYALTGSSFNRVRLGVGVFAFDHFYIGSQVALRSEVWNFAAPITQSHVQALGVIGYQF